MTSIFNIKYIKAYVVSALALCITMLPFTTNAFDISTYAESSKLATGRWAKISVTEDGIYMLSNSALRGMGFSDPSKVHIYGYGGHQLPDVLSQNNYIDDLPMVQCLRTDRGIIFYADGVTEAVVKSGKYVRPKQNGYSNVGYYFVSDCEGSDREIPTAGSGSVSSPETTFNNYIFHEKDLVCVAPTGLQYGGEDFLYTPSRNFNFELKDVVDDSNVSLSCSFITTANADSQIKISVNNDELPYSSSDIIKATGSDHGNYRSTITNKSFLAESDKLTIGINYIRSGTVSAAHLDYLAINYTQKLRLSGSSLIFSLQRNQAALENATANTIVWDITSPLSIVEMNTSLSGTTLNWTNDYTNQRRYVAFDPSASFAEPKYVGNVANQNLHAVEVPDMVIFTPATWKSEAKRLADFHLEYDSLKVLVVDQEEVFNEFASGSRDVNAFRKMLKMLYDRSSSADKQLKYALFMGRGSYDNRAISTSTQALNYPIMPIWQSEKGENDTDSYTTDDIFAFLQDNSGNNFASDYHCIGVGRMPVTSAGGARSAVDKIITYSTKMPAGTWRNRTMLLADDQDHGVHMEQMEQVWNSMLNNGGNNLIHTKLYTDAYQLTGQGYPQARDFMFRTLDEGIVWWLFIGHANTTSLTHENLLKLSDINNMYLRKWPIFFAATCDFLRWDGNSISAGEIMWGLEAGGCIAQIAANRPVYISENVYMSKALGKHMFTRDDNGNRLTIGEIYRRAKNSTKTTDGGVSLSDANKLRYILMGDPALYPALPQHEIVVDRINNIPIGGQEQAIMQARQSVIVEGRILDKDGNIIPDFDGIIASTLYDADYSVTTRANGGVDENGNEVGKQIIFEQHGERLFAGNDSVKAGQFKVHIAMPSEIANNFREASLSLTAQQGAGQYRAFHGAGVSREFYVYGTDENAVDTIPPVIKAIYLNHPSFVSGNHVNTAPMLIAEISDNRGINMNTSGIGHQMNILIDGKKSFSDVAQFYTPATNGLPEGTIAYQLPSLDEGLHSLRLRVWDTSDNSSSKSIEFYVSPDQAPVLYDVFTDVNPASTEANFYLSHDRPDANVEVTISVFNMLGKPVWESVTSGRSDMFLTSPVKWDLRNMAGQRVIRGIYLYRASIREGDNVSNTRTRRIAVTGN